MSYQVLVLNSGSSSIKYALYHASGDELERTEKGQIDRIGKNATFTCRRDGQEQQVAIDAAADHTGALQTLLDHLQEQLENSEQLAVGHRVVHGGTRFRHPVRVDREVVQELEKLKPLAPLHQPYNLAAIQALMDIDNELTQVACFDTSFHANQGKPVDQIPLPAHYHDEGLRRYGFHGLSYEYVSKTLQAIDTPLYEGKVIAAHLGNGASLCAMKNGNSVDTSMGFSALDGLMMGTRCGAIDAGVLLYLLQEKNMSPEALSDLLYTQSGLLGVSGISNDMRDLLNSDEQKAKEAIDLYVYRIVTGIGSMTASLQGLNGLVFTGGIGENAAPIRQRVCERLAWLGVHLDKDANNANAHCISSADSRVAVYVIPTNEELMIAQHTLAIVNPE